MPKPEVVACHILETQNSKLNKKMCVCVCVFFLEAIFNRYIKIVFTFISDRHCEKTISNHFINDFLIEQMFVSVSSRCTLAQQKLPDEIWLDEPNWKMYHTMR
jgi:hypothetical protein